ncbi:hypothetical protein C8R46DRAFT_1030577 [Mycena filopes]|nr:hypothetical protein C8R46DRAFT_1030577 [Mycena filopes]
MSQNAPSPSTNTTTINSQNANQNLQLGEPYANMGFILAAEGAWRPRPLGPIGERVKRPLRARGGEGAEDLWADLPHLVPIDDTDWVPIDRIGPGWSGSRARAEQHLATARAALADIDIAIQAARIALQDVEFARGRADAAISGARAALLASYLAFD